ncbi:MAG: signal peptidase I [Bacteroidales bacterium]|nr:signal peptidase I [Bacteroidales bacterium]
MVYDLLLVAYLVGVVAGLWLVFRKAGVAGWKAVVPVYNVVVWIKVCGKSRWWYLYFLVPAINVFTFLLLVVETAKVFRRYSFWEQTFAVIFPWIYLPLLGGLKTTQYHDPVAEPPARVSEARDWLDAIVFAVVAAVIIRGNIFELYQIPSSSMEKSLLVGDHLLVSKVAYGPRVAMTPLSVPLVHNVVPGLNVKSYWDFLQLPYHRYWGLGSVERYDAVVFNFPAGDTLLSGSLDGKIPYYDAVRMCGRDSVWSGRAVLTFGEEKVPCGEVIVRPVDKRENYIKRCIGLPGEDLQLIDQVVHINSQPIATPRDAQCWYAVRFREGFNPTKLLDKLGVSGEDMQNAANYWSSRGYAVLPLTQQMAAKLEKNSAVLEVKKVPDGQYGVGTLFGYPTMPADGLYGGADSLGWTLDNFGPLHIPAAGEVLQLTPQNLAFYSRVIVAYEGNSLRVENGNIYVNGEPTTTYKVKQNYYWMMGDNRHGSQDSRYWGFVPEDHVVGKAKWVLFSRDKDHRRIRWNRVLKSASAW